MFLVKFPFLLRAVEALNLESRMKSGPHYLAPSRPMPPASARPGLSCPRSPRMLSRRSLKGHVSRVQRPRQRPRLMKEIHPSRRGKPKQRLKLVRSRSIALSNLGVNCSCRKNATNALLFCACAVRQIWG